MSDGLNDGKRALLEARWHGSHSGECLHVFKDKLFRDGTESKDVFFARSVEILNENYQYYQHCMDHALKGCSHEDKPATEVPPQRQPRRGPGNGLHRSVHRGSARQTTALLAAGKIDIDEGDPRGYTSLILAAYFSEPSLVGLLLRAGANVSATTDDGCTALASSVQNENLEIATMLVKAGADVNTRYLDGRFPLFHTACNQNLTMAILFLKAGGDAGMPFDKGETPLHVAATVGHLRMVFEFIKAV